MQAIHGGDIYRNRIQIDFSVNINPLGDTGGSKKTHYIRQWMSVCSIRIWKQSS